VMRAAMTGMRMSVPHDTRTDALIELKRAEVPDRVLAAMVGKRAL
jgi:hypothetical protein